jgi:hypothetical protein
VVLGPGSRLLVNERATKQLEVRASPLWMADVIMSIRHRQDVLAAAQNGSKEEVDMRVAEEAISNFRANLINKYISKWQRSLGKALKEISDDPKLVNKDGSPIRSTLEVEADDEEGSNGQETLKVDDEGRFVGETVVRQAQGHNWR